MRSTARRNFPGSLSDPKGLRININTQLFDTNKAFVSPWRIVTCQQTLFASNIQKIIATSKRQCTCPHGNGIGIVQGDCVMFFIVNTELGRAVLLRMENNWRCPLSLRRFKDFQTEHLGDFVLLELPRFGSSSIWRDVNWPLIFQQKPDLILPSFGPSFSLTHILN